MRSWQNTDINPLKRSHMQDTDKTDKLAEIGLPKRAQVGEGPAVPTTSEVSLEDLLVAIRSVGKNTNAEISGLKQVVKNSLGTVKKLDDRVGGVEAIVESAHRMAKATKMEVQREETFPLSSFKLPPLDGLRNSSGAIWKGKKATQEGITSCLKASQK